MVKTQKSTGGSGGVVESSWHDFKTLALRDTLPGKCTAGAFIARDSKWLVGVIVVILVVPDCRT